MATNLNISENQERVPLTVGTNSALRSITPDDGSPYYVGARAYVTQTAGGAIVTVIDKDGTTTATINNGVGISDISKTGTSGLVDTYTITYDNGDTDTFTVTNGATGATGAAAGFGTVTATVDSSVGTPAVTVTTSGLDTAKNFDFAFSNLKGDKGDKGDIGNWIPYGECSTSANLPRKDVTITGVSELTTGLLIAVKFTYSNTALNPNLKVNSLDEKAIKRYGSTAVSTSVATSWNAESVVLLMYDGSYWQLVDFNNTTYTSMTSSEMEAGTATTARTITAARLKNAVRYWQTTYFGMTQDEMQAGTSTTSRLISPARLKEAIAYYGALSMVAEYGTSTYTDVYNAYSQGAEIFCTADDNGNTAIYQLVYFDATNEIFYFSLESTDGCWYTTLSNADGWADGTIQYATTDVATQLANGLMSALDKQKLDGLSKRNIWYGTCSTSASQSPKEITTASGDFSLTNGSMLVVKFSNTNSLSSASLQVDGGTSKSVYQLDGTSNIANRWGGGEVVMFAYDGTKFILLDQSTASTTQYGITKLNNTVTSTSTSEAATANAVKTVKDSVPTNVSDLPNDARYIKAYEEHSGDIVTFKDTNINDLVADIEPIQSGSGDPSPSNVRPISGHTDVVVSRSGKNLCDTSLVYNGYINSSQQKIASNANARTLYLPCKPNTAYTVSKQAGQRFIVAETTEIPTNNVVVRNIVLDYTASSLTITTTASAKYLVAFVYLSTADTGVTADQMLATCQIELGLTASTYEPYQGDTYTTALGTTVYGGTLDVTTGVLTVTHKLVNCDGSEQWGMVSSGYFTIAKSNLDATLSTTEAHSDTMICNRLPWLSTQPNTTASFNAVTHTVRVSMPSITSLANFKTYLGNNNLQFILELATPTTTTLTAQQISTLLGENNVWGNTGQVEVKCVGSFNHTMLVELFYPIGSYYDTSDANFDPNNSWGGTWASSTSGGVTTWHRTA